SPFAAVIELTNGNWSDPRVAASMAGVFLLIMFMYLTASTAVAGRTWGMSLFALRAVDADTGDVPTMRQCVGRAIVYMISLAALGVGILYALFDAEGRAAHDHLSGTAVIRD
ncbi:MAG TPA: RDD family protein, partial [Pyrinomonadaceae bacterium]